MDAVSFLLCSIPFWIPAGIGLYLVVNKPNELSHMAGLFTLKPILATPIWFAIVSSLRGPVDGLEPAHFLSILPGASLTIIIAAAFRRVFSGPRAGRARVLLVLDCARWLNSFLLSLSYSSGIMGMGEGVVCILSLIGLALPTVFAVVALTFSLTSAWEF